MSQKPRMAGTGKPAARTAAKSAADKTATTRESTSAAVVETEVSAAAEPAAIQPHAVETAAPAELEAGREEPVLEPVDRVTETQADADPVQPAMVEAVAAEAACVDPAESAPADSGPGVVQAEAGPETLEDMGTVPLAAIEVAVPVPAAVEPALVHAETMPERPVDADLVPPATIEAMVLEPAAVEPAETTPTEAEPAMVHAPSMAEIPVDADPVPSIVVEAVKPAETKTPTPPTYVTNLLPGMKTMMKSTEDFVAFGQANMEAFVKSSQIWAAGVQDLTKQFATTAKASFDESVSTFKAMTTVKSVKEAIELQSTFAKTSMEKAISESNKLTDASIKLTEQTLAPITARVTSAVETFSKAA